MITLDSYKTDFTVATAPAGDTGLFDVVAMGVDSDRLPLTVRVDLLAIISILEDHPKGASFRRKVSRLSTAASLLLGDEERSGKNTNIIITATMINFSSFRRVKCFNRPGDHSFRDLEQHMLDEIEWLNIQNNPSS